MNTDWNYRLVNYFLHHRQLTAMLFGIIVLGGIFSFARFRVEGFPAVEIPLAIVNVIVPGAGPETVDKTVTTPIQNKIQDIKGITQISANSQANVSTVIVQFEEGKNTEVLGDLRAKLAELELPQGAQTPQIIVPDINSAPFFVAVTGNKTLAELNAEGKTLQDTVLEVSTVKSVEKTAGPESKIYIDVPVELQAAGIAEQIKNANLAFPLGSIVDQGKEISVSSSKATESLEQLKNLPVILPGTPPGTTVRLGDVASIYEGLDLDNQVHRIGYLSEDGQTFRVHNAVVYGINLKAETDLLRAEKDVLAAVKSADEKLTSSEIVVVYNQAAESREQVDELVAGAIGGKWEGFSSPFAQVGYLFGGIWLLVIAMLLFLDWRSAIISALAIPLSFLFTFIVLGFLDIQLNTIVLFSLIVVLGLIVDPAIVVLESIHRYMELGERGNRAVLRSISVIGPGLFIAVLTSLIVFTPFAIVSGTFGQIIKYIPITVIPALAASYFVPLIFLTWLGGRFLKPKHVVVDTNEDTIENLWPIAKWFVRMNRFILSKWWVSTAVVILGVLIPILISAALFASGKVKQVQFASGGDSLFIQATAPLSPSLTYQSLLNENAKLENVLAKHVENIEHYFYADFTGTNNGGLSVLIELKAHTERELASSEISEKLTQDLRAEFGPKASASDLGAGPPTPSYPVTVKIFGNNAESLSEASRGLAEQLKKDSRVSDVIFDSQTSQADTTLVLDNDKLASLGLSPAAVYGQIASQLSEQTLFTLDEQDVVLRTPKNLLPGSPGDLGNLKVYGPSGAIDISQIAQAVTKQVPANIKTIEGEQYTEVSARVNDTKDAIAVQREIIQWGKDNTDQLGVETTAFDERAGVDDFEKSFQELFAAIALSILLTYFVFVLFFKSFLQPLIILFAVPLMFIGIFPSLVVFADGQFGFLEIIGIIMVIGIVENVGIFLIDYANRKVSEGMDKREAVAISSGIRFRAIVLTKLTALAGLLPLAVFAPFWRGLAVVVIMGIVSSGILSLFTTPVLYTWLTRKRKTASSL